MNNINLICFSSQIQIGNNLTEQIFAHKDNTILNHFTHRCNYHFSEEDHINILKEYPEIRVKDGCLFYSFPYQKSFAHFMTQTVPILFDFFHSSPNTLLLIPSFSRNKLIENILNLCGVSSDRILWLEDYIKYTVEHLTERVHYEAPPANFNHKHIWTWNKIRQGLQINPRNPYRKVYLKKDGIPNAAFGNSETGVKRCIINEEALLSVLKEEGFEIVTLGDKSIEEKSNLLADCKVLITQLGANCINLFFSNAPEKVLTLSNTEPIGENYYVSACETLNKSNINHTIMYWQGNPSYSDPTNRWNTGFSVDINAIQNYLRK